MDPKGRAQRPRPPPLEGVVARPHDDDGGFETARSPEEDTDPTRRRSTLRIDTSPGELASGEPTTHGGEVEDDEVYESANSQDVEAQHPSLQGSRKAYQDHTTAAHAATTKLSSARGLMLQQSVPYHTATSAAAISSATSFPPDCGPKDYKFLSYRRAEFIRRNFHPNQRVGSQSGALRVMPYPICHPTGSHSCVGHEESDLAKYGVGVVLYFRFLKYMAVCFFLLSVASLPAISFFWEGSATLDADKAVAVQETGGLAGLFYTTLGSLGEGSTVCRKAKEGYTAHIICPHGAIGEVQAYYGQPHGDCNCPGDQQLDSNGYCQGWITHAYGSDGTCATSKPCFPGTTWTGQKCCAYTQTADKEPDLTALEVKPVEGCNSNTAHAIVAGQCRGKSNCTVEVSASKTQKWTGDANDAVGCYGATSIKTGEPCSASFDQSGNFTLCPSATERYLIVVAKCYDVDIGIAGHTYSRKSVVRVLSYMDTIGCALWLLAVVYLGFKERQEARHIDGDVCTAADYTVCVRGLPETDDPQQLHTDLRRHLCLILNAAKPIKTPHVKIKIADINSIFSDVSQIALLRQRGVVARKLDRLDNQVQLLERTGRARRSKAEVARRRIEIMRTQRQFKALNHRLEAAVDRARTKVDDAKHHPVATFVTFETEEGYARCLQTFPSSGLPCVTKWWYPTSLRFRGQHALWIRRAVEPRSLIWENFLSSKKKPIAYMYRTATVVITLGLLLFSFLLIYKAKVAQSSASLLYPSVDCSGYIVDKSQDYTDRNDDDNPLTVGQVVRDYYWREYNESTGAYGLLQCFCQGLHKQYGLTTMLTYDFAAPSGGQERLCWPWFETMVTVRTLVIVSTLSVVIINVLLQWLLRRLAVLEKHNTRTQQVGSLTVKLALAQFVNMALLIIVINANTGYFYGYGDSGAEGVDTGFDLKLFTGDYADFSEGWYYKVGAAIISTMLLNMAMPHLPVLLTAITTMCKKCWDRRCSFNKSITRKTTQKELEDLYLGPRFEIETRYAQILTTVFVCMTYSAGIPLLMPICFTSVLVTYWVDKVAFLRLYRTPPTVDSTVASISTALLPLAGILHLAVSIWMLSNRDIFEQTSTSGLWTSPSGNSTSIHASTSSTASAHTADLFAGRIFHPNNMLSLPILLVTAAVLVLCALYRVVTSGGMLKVLVWRICSFLPPTYHWQDNQPYFHAIPTETLHYRLETGILKEGILNKYKAELARRAAAAGEQGPTAKAEHPRTLEGLETYDYRGDPDYIESFALDSRAIQTYMQEHQRARSGLSPRESSRRFGAGQKIRRAVVTAVGRIALRSPVRSPLGCSFKRKAQKGDQVTPRTAPEGLEWGDDVGGGAGQQTTPLKQSKLHWPRSPRTTKEGHRELQDGPDSDCPTPEPLTPRGKTGFATISRWASLSPRAASVRQKRIDGMSQSGPQPGELLESPQGREAGGIAAAPWAARTMQSIRSLSPRHAKRAAHEQMSSTAPLPHTDPSIADGGHVPTTRTVVELASDSPISADVPHEHSLHPSPEAHGHAQASEDTAKPSTWMSRAMPAALSRRLSFGGVKGDTEDVQERLSSTMPVGQQMDENPEVPVRRKMDLSSVTKALTPRSLRARGLAPPSETSQPPPAPDAEKGGAVSSGAEPVRGASSGEARMDGSQRSADASSSWLAKTVSSMKRLSSSGSKGNDESRGEPPVKKPSDDGGVEAPASRSTKVDFRTLPSRLAAKKSEKRSTPPPPPEPEPPTEELEAIESRLGQGEGGYLFSDEALEEALRQRRERSGKKLDLSIASIGRAISRRTKKQGSNVSAAGSEPADQPTEPPPPRADEAPSEAAKDRGIRKKDVASIVHAMSPTRSKKPEESTTASDAVAAEVPREEAKAQHEKRSARKVDVGARLRSLSPRSAKKDRQKAEAEASAAKAPDGDGGVAEVTPPSTEEAQKPQRDGHHDRHDDAKPVKRNLVAMVRSASPRSRRKPEGASESAAKTPAEAGDQVPALHKTPSAYQGLSESKPLKRVGVPPIEVSSQDKASTNPAAPQPSSRAVGLTVDTSDATEVRVLRSGTSLLRHSSLATHQQARPKKEGSKAPKLSPRLAALVPKAVTIKKAVRPVKPPDVPPSDSRGEGRQTGRGGGTGRAAP